MEIITKNDRERQKAIVDSWLAEKEAFVNDQYTRNPNANPQVIYFIADILYHNISGCEVVRSLFHDGYCLYFAEMLKTAFNRGTVCWAAPFGHFVWKDDNDVCYDIEGVTISEADYFIPISFLGRAIDDFRHVRGVYYNASQDDINEIIDRYKKSLLYTNTYKDIVYITEVNAQ